MIFIYLGYLYDIYIYILNKNYDDDMFLRRRRNFSKDQSYVLLYGKMILIFQWYLVPVQTTLHPRPEPKGCSPASDAGFFRTFTYLCSIRVNERVYVFWALRTYMYVKKTHHWKTVLSNELSVVEERGVWISCHSKVEPYSNWTKFGGFGTWVEQRLNWAWSTNHKSTH